MPFFIKLNHHDRLTQSCEAVDDAVVAEWLERRLLGILKAYLRVDRGLAELSEEPVIAPVCGMRITRSSVVASSPYRGQRSVFGSQACKVAFSHDPTGYALAKTL